MKKIVLATVVAMSVMSGAAFAAHVYDPHDLMAVHEHLIESIHEMERARAANHYDMAGHGAKAEALMRQAEEQLKEAVGSSKKF